MSVRSGSKSLCGTGLCLCRFLFAVLGHSSSFERAEKASRNAGDFTDGSVERRFVRLRRLVEAADLSDKLERGCLDFFLSARRVEVEEDFHVPAHGVVQKLDATAKKKTQKLVGRRASSSRSENRRLCHPQLTADSCQLPTAHSCWTGTHYWSASCPACRSAAPWLPPATAGSIPCAAPTRAPDLPWESATLPYVYRSAECQWPGRCAYRPACGRE